MNKQIDTTGTVGVDDVRFEALQRLKQSRAKLKAVLLPAPVAARVRSTIGQSASTTKQRLRGAWESITARTSSSGVASAAASLVKQWWTRQPWHSATELVGDAVSGEVEPLIRRNPLTSIAVSACAGAAVVALRPWRWNLVQTQSRKVSGTMGRWAVGQIAQPAVQLAVVAGLTAWLDQRKSSTSRTP